VIAKCANPACLSLFDHRVGGKFFRFHLPDDPAERDAQQIHNTHNVVHYWLCPLCSKLFSLISQEEGHVLLRNLEREFAPDDSADPRHLLLTAA
jgi:hypothetical protein